MGEMNPMAPDEYFVRESVMEYLARYLYENYEPNPNPMRDDDPRNTCIGMVEPWESAGKRMREKWFTEAENLAGHVSRAFVGAV